MKIEDYFKYYIQGSDHYLIPKDVFKELFNEMINWKEESQRQKEVIDKAIKYIKSYKTDYSPYELSDYNIRQILDILNEVSE